MRRVVSLLTAALLAGCAASAQTESTTPTHGVAYVDVTRIEAMPQWRSFYSAYDRETASLQATQNVPKLSDTRPIAQHQANVVRDGAREATTALDALRSRADAYQPRLPDAAAIRSQIEQNYGRQASTVQAKVDASERDYRAQLETETQHALKSYRASLDSRVNTAYAARAQQLHEKEAELEIRLDRQDADQDLLLRVKLQNLKSPQVDRPALKARLAALEARENRARTALEAQNARTLAAYRSQLVAQASHDYATMSAELQRKAQANWALRQRVAQEQRQAPQALDVPAAANTSFANRWSQFRTDSTATAAAFTSSADDIARRFSVIGDEDTQARGSAGGEIEALQHDRSALRQQIGRAAYDLAAHLAKDRNLTLVDHPVPGAVDLTTTVSKLLVGTLSP